MIISSSITIGQITFVLRVAIQILSYGGLALVTLIIVANAPRVAPLDTHNVLNHVIGKWKCTSTSGKWILSRLLRGGRKDPLPSTKLLIALFLFISYTAFVAISDIGFLGFYACSVPGPNLIDTPASVSSNDAARALIAKNLVNGTDPSNVKAYRCDAVKVVNFDVNVAESNCTAWRNSTYADINLFGGINSTDTDVLMPRRLTHHNHSRAQFIDLNSFYLAPNSQRVTNATIEEGYALFPHDTGIRVVLGVPQLAPQHKIDLDKTMALEVDVGCMTLGVYSQHSIEVTGSTGIDVLATQGNWRTYAGPDYLRDVLANTTDIIREYYRPLFDPSSLDSSGFMYSINSTQVLLSGAANVVSFKLPAPGLQSGPDSYILGNCTQALQNKLGIPISQQADGMMCGLLAIGGSMAGNGTMHKGLSRMVCATATQVNMVAANIAVDAGNQVSLNVTRLPSDLNYLRADYWDLTTQGNNSVYTNYVPYERYTLNDNPSSPTTHFIPHQKVVMLDATYGPGSGGTTFSRIGDMMLAYDVGLTLDIGYAGLALLEQGYNHLIFNPTQVTTWAGGVGASFFSSTIGYNGWAARESMPIRVVSTGGTLGSCYKPHYALGFVPLLLAAFFVIVWAFSLSVRSSLLGSAPLQLAYGGMGPYKGAVCPGAPNQDTLLTWEKAPEPYLQVVSKGYPVNGDAPETALKYLKTSNAYPFSS
jgi:hypothetical protein